MTNPLIIERACIQNRKIEILINARELLTFMNWGGYGAIGLPIFKGELANAECVQVYLDQAWCGFVCVFAGPDFEPIAEGEPLPRKFLPIRGDSIEFVDVAMLHSFLKLDVPTQPPKQIEEPITFIA